MVQKDFMNNDVIDKWFMAMYWAFQTLTTVGYGDFGAYNNAEIWLTLVWMFVGVAFYTFVVGSLTTVITENQS